MASINVDLDYPNHVKTKRLQARMGPEADLWPMRLWLAAGKYWPSGFLPISAEELEVFCGWNGEKGKLVESFLEVEFLSQNEKGWVINDWKERNGHLIILRERSKTANKIRWNRYKLNHKNKDSIKDSNQRDLGVQPTQTRNPLAVQCSAVQGSKEDTPLPPKGGFERLWEMYPRREGKKAAERRYKASVKTFKDWLDIQNALDHYLKHIRTNKTEMQFIKHGSTWFNNWQDWINYTEDENGRHGRERVFGDDAFTQRVIEAQGLRKENIGGPAGKILARIRDRPVDVEKSDPADRAPDIENGEPVE